VLSLVFNEAGRAHLAIADCVNPQRYLNEVLALISGYPVRRIANSCRRTGSRPLLIASPLMPAFSSGAY